MNIWEGFQEELSKLSENLARDIFNYLGSIESKSVGRDTISHTIGDSDTISDSDIDIDYIIDTCRVNDINAYETGIRVQFRNGKTILPWVIVEYYLNEEEALLGHNRWSEYILEEAPTFFVSVQDKKIYGFTREDI